MWDTSAGVDAVRAIVAVLFVLSVPGLLVGGICVVREVVRHEREYRATIRRLKELNLLGEED